MAATNPLNVEGVQSAENEKRGVAPLRGHTHSFPNSGQGWKKEPHALERGDPTGWESPMQSLTPELPEVEQSGGKAYRQSLGHVCTMASSSIEFERTRRDTVRYLEMQTSLRGLDQTSSKYAPSPWWGASIPPGLSPCRERISAS